MSVAIKLRCNGCPAETDGTALIRQYFEPVWSGSNFGKWRTGSIADVVPEGWVAFDPYTGMTYCPTCWASIVGEGASESEVGGSTMGPT